MSKIRVAKIVRESVVDGPGFRTVVFTQGCPRRCKGCHNPELLPGQGGEELTASELVDKIEAGLTRLIRGVTFSGGDPLMQPEALHEVLQLLKKRNPDLDIWVYTGYQYEETKDLPVMELVDVLVDGPYVEEQRDISLPFKGSVNQRIIDVQATRERGEIVEWKR